MRYVIFGALLFSFGCSTSPTAPTPTPPVAVTPPVVVSPPVQAPPPPTRNPLLDDPRFDRNFYRQFVHNAFDGPFYPSTRQTQAPTIYLMTVDDQNRPIDARTLDSTAAALINTTGQLTGAFGLAGLTQGTQPMATANQIVVLWSSQITTYCGEAPVGGNRITLYPRTPNCACGGLAIRTGTVKHELGHALGYWHTDAPTDLMYGTSPQACDRHPSEREIFHARLAYSMPVGSLDP